MRGERVLQDNLRLHSMKKLQLDVTKVEKGIECGLCFENFDGGGVARADGLAGREVNDERRAAGRAEFEHQVLPSWRSVRRGFGR